MKIILLLCVFAIVVGAIALSFSVTNTQANDNKVVASDVKSITIWYRGKTKSFSPSDCNDLLSILSKFQSSKLRVYDENRKHGSRFPEFDLSIEVTQADSKSIGFYGWELIKVIGVNSSKYSASDSDIELIYLAIAKLFK